MRVTDRKSVERHPARYRRNAKPSAFTLIEVLVVVSILSILASILLPVMATARESSRRSACLSNARQAGLAILIYAQDNDESFPNGLNENGSGRIWPAEGWAGQTSVYLHNPHVLACPDDTTFAGLTGPVDQPVSYAMNANVVGYSDQDDPPPSGVSCGALASPTRTVLLFEVAGVTANASAHQRRGDQPGQCREP